MGRYGVIDFGSNTIRLCVYEVSDPITSKITRADIRTLLNYKEMAGIASYIADGELNPKGMKRAGRVIKAQVELASYFECNEVEVFATAVLRNCANSKEAKRKIEHLCEAPITILSSDAEAHLGLVGVLVDTEIKNATVVDIGGGSTELSAVKDGIEVRTDSLPIGSLSAFSNFLSGLLPKKGEIEQITMQFDTLFDALPKKTFRTDHLVGIGGAVRAAAKVYGDLFKNGERSTTLLPAHLDKILKTYCDQPEVFMRNAVRTIPDRIHTFIPGCAIIHAVFEKTGATELTITKSGIREGYLVEHILQKPAC